MAWLERRANSYRIVFRFASEKFHYSLKTGNERTATAALARLEENLYLLEHGRLELPPGADLATFLISDGKLNGKPVIEKALTLGEMIDRYKKELPEGAKEASTRYSEKVHLGHL